MVNENHKKKLLMEVMSDKQSRIAFCEKSFKHFLLYYLSESLKYPRLAEYHESRCKDFQGGKHMYVEGHRESAKTTILGVANRIRKICYRKKRFMVNVCHEKKKAEAFNKIIVNILLTNEKIREDFGVLFNKTSLQTNADDDLVSEKGIKEFVTTNGIKIKAFGMGEAVRGEIFYTKDKGIVRPDDLFVDDIDNHDNTKNKRIIEDDMEFIKGEVFGGLTADKQIIWLGNIIRRDGRNPRMRAQANTDKDRVVYRNFIYGEPGKETGIPIRGRFVNTDSDAAAINAVIDDPDMHVISLEMKKRTEGSGYAQNRLGIPLAEGEKLFKMSWVQKISKNHLPLFDYVQIGGDPAFSLKQTSDAFGIVVTGIRYVGNEIHYYVLTHRNLKGEEKREVNYKSVIKQLYSLYGCSRIKIEKNNGGEVCARLLQAEGGMAVDVFSTSKDKSTHFKEYEGHFMAMRVFFVEGETEEVINQLELFTGEEGNEDDLVDALLNSFSLESFIDVTF